VRLALAFDLNNGADHQMDEANNEKNKSWLNEDSETNGAARKLQHPLKREKSFNIFRLDVCTIERVVRSHLLMLNFATIKIQWMR
jgi:hypothetical protein